MKSWHDISIKHKLAIGFGLSLIAIILLSTLITNLLMRDVATQRIHQQELPHALSSVTAQLEMEIAIPKNIAHQMAYNPYLLDWLHQGESQDTLKQVQNYLKSVRQDSGADFSFLVSANTGNYYTPDGLLKTLSKDNAKDQWFYGFLNSGQSVSLDLDIDESQGIYTLFVNYLTPDKSAVTGIGISVKNLSNLVKTFRIGHSGGVFLTDKNGLIKLHPDAKKVGKSRLADLGYSDLDLNALLSGNKTQIQSSNGVIVASRYIPSLGWYLISEISEQEVFADIDASSRTMVLINLALALGFLLLGVYFARSMSRPIMQTVTMLDSIASGEADLSKKLHSSGGDEIGQLAVAFNHFVEKLRQIVLNLSTTVHEVESTTHEVNRLADHTKLNVDDQLSNIDSVATAINEMGATVHEIARNASDTATAASDSAKEADLGLGMVKQTVSSIQTLNQDIQTASDAIHSLASDIGQIDNVLEVIRSVSEQTNLLALNAAIEAARAGEQGRGFAVVADEVRTLASRTQESTEEIGKMIDQLQQGAKNAVSAMKVGTGRAQEAVTGAEKTSDSLARITQRVQSISDMSLQVATATEEQSSVVEELNEHIHDINQKAQETASASDDTAHTCQRQYQSIARLVAEIGNFKT